MTSEKYQEDETRQKKTDAGEQFCHGYFQDRMLIIILWHLLFLCWVSFLYVCVSVFCLVLMLLFLLGGGGGDVCLFSFAVAIVLLVLVLCFVLLGFCSVVLLAFIYFDLLLWLLLWRGGGGRSQFERKQLMSN